MKFISNPINYLDIAQSKSNQVSYTIFTDTQTYNNVTLHQVIGSDLIV